MRTPLLFLCILLLVLPRAVHSQLTYALQIHFENNSADISQHEYKRIDSVLALLKPKNFRYSVQLTGHADSSGSIRQNNRIALKRAVLCKALLVQKGFSQKNVQVVSKGSTRPIYPNNTEFGRAINRRVDFLFTELPPEQVIRRVDRLSEVLRQQQFKVSAEKGGRVKYSSGTELIIPARSFVDAAGNEVKGKVDISYVEMRDPLDIALSDIDMTHGHNGEAFIMNSGGMFRMLAGQNGKPVYLNGDSAVGVNFALTQALPNSNFYTYDSITRKWTEQRKLRGSNGQSLRPRADNYYSADFRRYNAYCSMPEFESYLFKVNMGIRMADPKLSLYKQLMTIDSVGALKALARSDSAEAVATKTKHYINSKQVELAKAQHGYKIEVLEQKDSLCKFKIVCRANAYNELENFKKVHWQVNSTGNAKSLHDLSGRTWTQCEIVETGVAFSIVFKNHTRTIRLNDVLLEADKRMGKPDETSYYQALGTQYTIRYKKYQEHLENLQADIDAAKEVLMVQTEAAAQLKKACGRFNWYYDRIFSDSLYCFWSEHLRVMSPPERSMRFENWLQFYDSHRHQYLGMYLREKKSAKYAFCKARDRQYRYYLALLEAEAGRIGEQNKMVESLQIRQMGYCNIYALVRYNLGNTAAMAFKDAKGTYIDVACVKLIDNEINSAFSFYDKLSPNEIEMRYNPQAQSALLVFDAAGNLYVCGSNAFKREVFSSGDMHMELAAVKVEDKKNKALIKTLMQL